MTIKAFDQLSTKNWANEPRQHGSKHLLDGVVYCFGKEVAVSAVFKAISEKLSAWQKKHVESVFQSKTGELIELQVEEGYLWIVQAAVSQSKDVVYDSERKSAYAKSRDLAGSFISRVKNLKLKHLSLKWIDLSDEQEGGFIVGLGLGTYRFTEVQNSKGIAELPHLEFTKNDRAFKVTPDNPWVVLSMATNITRHLVNLAPGDLYPEAFSAAIKKILSREKTVHIEVLDEKKLKKEKMNLILAVGQGSAHPPRLVKIRYRPKKPPTKKVPIAFIGKGITFDTGGLDLKPASGMRLMKKDMGGAAALVGLCYYLSKTQASVNADFYLALAENSVGSNSFRPSDIITARNGKTVEIHNTDAEGRLVMADALDFARTQKGKDQPDTLIDVSTLTGAAKVALGTGVAALFSNHDELARQLAMSGFKAGDYCWRLPLVESYQSLLKTNFADLLNCSVSEFGGSITAALFLKHFVGDTKWAHFDIYAWQDGASGAIQEGGASGQAVQLLAHYLKNEYSI